MFLVNVKAAENDIVCLKISATSYAFLFFLQGKDSLLQRSEAVL
jgi:hypothetical protein